MWLTTNYHSAHRPFLEAPDQSLVDFEKTGTTFANSAVTHPRYCAAVLRTLIKGLGADHVIWGTDSVWYGSPQWQIEAFRRIEIPEDMQRQYGFAPLGPADGSVKRAILGFNGARLFGVALRADGRTPPADYRDRLARLKAEYEAAGPRRSNAAYGFVRRRA